MIINKTSPIGFFDSGLGGLSVLKRSLNELPYENYIYFGDSINAPYGGRSKSEIIDLTINAIEFLKGSGCKAVVIACNTAYTNSEDAIVKKYVNFPVIGIKPPISEAVNNNLNKKVIIMATEATIKSDFVTEKVNELNSKANIIKMPCKGLVELIESGKYSGNEVKEYLYNKFKDHLVDKPSIVILGCTHYPFIKETLSEILGSSTTYIEGGQYSIMNLNKILKGKNLLNDSNVKGYVKILNSSKNESMIELSKKLLYDI